MKTFFFLVALLHLSCTIHFSSLYLLIRLNCLQQHFSSAVCYQNVTAHSSIKVATRAFGRKVSTVSRERSAADRSQLETYLSPNVTRDPAHRTRGTFQLSLPFHCYSSLLLLSNSVCSSSLSLFMLLFCLLISVFPHSLRGEHVEIWRNMIRTGESKTFLLLLSLHSSAPKHMCVHLEYVYSLHS